MSYNARQTHLIIHKHIQYALQASQEEVDYKCSVQLAPIIEHNKRQHWLLQGQIEDTFSIVNASTDYCLTEEEERFILKGKLSSRHQTWVLWFVSDHQFLIKLPKDKSKYLCLRNGILVFCQCQSSKNADIWVLKTILDDPILDSSCFLISTDCNRLIDAAEGSRDKGSIVSVKQPNYHHTQRWNIFKAGQIYVIKSFFTQLNLDIFQERFYTQNDVVLWPSNGEVSQFWFLQKLYGSAFRISTFFDPQLQLGHFQEKLIIHKGRKYTWVIEGLNP